MPLKLMNAFVCHERSIDFSGAGRGWRLRNSRPACTMVVLFELLASKVKKLKEKQQKRAT
jgi:hypothetical protein